MSLRSSKCSKLHLIHSAEIVSRITRELGEALGCSRGEWGIKIHWDEVEPRSPIARCKWYPAVRVTYKAGGLDRVEYRLPKETHRGFSYSRSAQSGPGDAWKLSAIFNRLSGIFELVASGENEKAAEQLRSFADDVIALSRSRG